MSTLEERVAALEDGRASPAFVWVVLYDYRPYAVVTSEAAAEDLVVSLLKPGLSRAIGSGCWFKMPLV